MANKKKTTKRKAQVKVVSVRKPARKAPVKMQKTQQEHSILYQLAMKVDYQLGRYAFIVGVLACLIFTITHKAVPPVELGIFLIVLGAVIGLLNVTHEERHKFLVAVIALIVLNGANISVIKLWNIGPFIQVFIFDLMILFAPAALIVALESIYSLAKNR